MSKNRYYGSGVEKALFMLSRGTCYEPTCKASVLRMTKTGTPRVNVQIAHIYPLGEDEARFDRKHPRDSLNKFTNLLLLCQTHHIEVDSELWKEYYPAEVLIEWKKKREGNLSNVLENLPPLQNDEQFQNILTGLVSRMHDEIITAIDEVSGVSQETLTLLKELVSDSFSRPYLPEETVTSLEYSARVFEGMGEHTTMLHESARNLQGIEDHAWMLYGLRELPEYAPLLLDAVRKLNTILPEHVAPLSAAANKLNELPDHAHLLIRFVEQLEATRLWEVVDRIDQIEDAARQLNSATTYAPELIQAAQNIQATTQTTERTTENWSWSSFRWGLGACFVAIIVLLVLWTFAIK